MTHENIYFQLNVLHYAAVLQLSFSCKTAFLSQSFSFFMRKQNLMAARGFVACIRVFCEEVFSSCTLH